MPAHEVCSTADQLRRETISPVKYPSKSLDMKQLNIRNGSFPTANSQHNIIKDNCCTVQLKFSFSDTCKTEIDFVRIFTKRDILVKRPAIEFLYKNNPDRFYSPGYDYPYKLGLVKNSYTILNSTVLFLPDRQNIQWSDLTDSVGCVIMMEYLFRPHRWIVNGPPPSPVFNKTDMCIADKCYHFSLVVNVTWNRASEICAESGGHLPVFNTRGSLQEVLISSMHYRQKKEESLSTKELKEWNFQMEDFNWFDENFAHTSMAMLGSPFIYLGLSTKQQVYSIMYPPLK